ncbi:MAG: glycosyltransferase [Candidatus Verstraetearchaeota archaeon]|nr:glycosyltransferase [Candidatus Verstraetearchaeota archaeon]
MKPVLHLTWEYPPWRVGGLSDELKRTLPELASRVQTLLVVRGDKDETSEIDGMRLYKVSSSTRSCPHVLAYIHALNIDLVRGASAAIHDSRKVPIVHAHDWVSGLAGVYLKDIFRAPLLISVYSTELTRSKLLGSLLSMGIYDVERHCFDKADRLIVKEPGMREHLERQFGITPAKILEAGTADRLLEVYRVVST